jgi:hypothetical protein
MQNLNPTPRLNRALASVARASGTRLIGHYLLPTQTVSNASSATTTMRRELALGKPKVDNPVPLAYIPIVDICLLSFGYRAIDTAP